MIYTRKIVLLLFIFSLQTEVLPGGDDFLSETKIVSPLKDSELQSTGYKLQNAIHNIYELYKDSIVFISTEKTVPVKPRDSLMFDPFFRDYLGDSQSKTKKLRGLGTGFIISSDGYICTNQHVVAKADYLAVKIGNEVYPAKIIGTDQLTDIALIKIESKKKFKPVYFGDSEKVRIGDFVVAIGNPFGLDKTYTFGIVSAIGRKNVDAMGNSHIQTDASINTGNSGGPLINMDGEVIGVNRIIYSGSGGSIGIGFAITINPVIKTLTILKKQARITRGYIGVDAASITEEFSHTAGLKSGTGVIIKSMIKNGPASMSGLKVNDVILKINNREIQDYRDLVTTVTSLEVGRTATITILRNNKVLDYRVVVAEHP